VWPRADVNCNDPLLLLALDLEMAIAYWNIVMKGRFKFLDLWCSFLMVSVHLSSPPVFSFHSHCSIMGGAVGSREGGPLCGVKRCG